MSSGGAQTVPNSALDQQQIKDLSYAELKELDCLVRLKISHLGGRIPGERLDDVEAFSDLQLTCQLWSRNNPQSPVVQATYRHQEMDTALQIPGSRWNEWVYLPVKYRDLDLCSQITITVWKWNQHLSRLEPLGGSTFRMFGKHNTLRKGRHRLRLHHGVEADGSWPSETPSKSPGLIDDLERLDRLVKHYESGDIRHVSWLDPLTLANIQKQREVGMRNCDHLFLYVDLPHFDFPIVFDETVYEVPYQPPKNPMISFVYDPDMLLENLVEAKHRRLVRSHRSGPTDRNLKPNAKIRDELNSICQYPPTQNLSAQESDLVWKFRFYLSRDKKALTKFLKAVDWKDNTEVKQATEILLPIWVDIAVDDALELLGPTFKHPAVRQYAVKHLERADDDDLCLYLLQLVQAVKYEQINDRGAYESSLVEFLTTRAIKNPILGNYFHWYLMTECDDKTQLHAKTFAKVAYYFMSRLVDEQDGHKRREILRRQGELVEKLCQITRDLRNMKDARPKKIEWLRGFIADPKNNLLKFQNPIPLPLDASITIEGVVPETANVFKSQLTPLLLTFHCPNDADYSVIFKLGDDLRQDQLILQVITLMDKLWRKENLDLRLSPYKVLATGSDNGLLQFVPSQPLAKILGDYSGNLQAYLRQAAPNPSALESFGIEPAVMDTYIKSCAGYCVITYLLGIGDRHLDNLLLTPKGNLFHIDFGYILGRDPKPFPPPMKLCKEMVDAMGGTSSIHYQKFKSLCYTAFIILRKSSNLILNLFALMQDANVPDIRLEPDKAVMKVQEKFRLDLTDEAAIQFFQQLINDSVNALFPQLMETVHKWAQYWRK